MSVFRESFQKELGRGTAYFLVAAGVWIVLLIAGLLPGDKRPALTLLLFLGSGFLVWLLVILFLRLVSYRKSDNKISDLERRLEESEAERESMSDFLNEAGIFDNPKSLKRIIKEQDSIYDVEHQDDGR